MKLILINSIKLQKLDNFCKTSSTCVSSCERAYIWLRGGLACVKKKLLCFINGQIVNCRGWRRWLSFITSLSRLLTCELIGRAGGELPPALPFCLALTPNPYSMPRTSTPNKLHQTHDRLLTTVEIGTTPVARPHR